MGRPLDPDRVSDEPPAVKEDRSIGELFADLTRETTTLVRQEVDLAKTELSRKATEVGKDIGFLVAGGAVAYAGFLALIAAVIIGLSQAGVTWWLSALVVAVIVVGAGGFLVWTGLTNLKRETMAPLATIETLKEDARWAKEQTK